MEIKVKNYHVAALSLFIQSFDQDTKAPISGILLDDSLTLGTINLLSKIKKAANAELPSLQESEGVIFSRYRDENGIVAKSPEKQKLLQEDLLALGDMPCILEFEPVKMEYLEGVKNSIAKCSNPELIEIITGAYIYPEKTEDSTESTIAKIINRTSKKSANKK